MSRATKTDQMLVGEGGGGGGLGQDMFITVLSASQEFSWVFVSLWSMWLNVQTSEYYFILKTITDRTCNFCSSSKSLSYASR